MKDLTCSAIAHDPTPGLEGLVDCLPPTTGRPGEGRSHRPFSRANVAARRPVARHLLPDTAQIDARGRLSIGGVDVLDLVAEVGTPVFVYDEQHLRNRCREARRGFGPGVAYASKAFLCKAMARLAYEEGMDIDVSTGGELHVALSSGVPADRLVLHGSNKSDEELDRALTSGVGRIVIDSFDEIARLDRLVKDCSPARSPRVLVRVNPGVAPDTHAYVTTGQEDSKFGFGISSGAASSAIERLMRLSAGLDLVGLHVHVGSQVVDLTSIKSAISEIADLFVPLGLRELCVGGGLGVSYTGDSAAPSIGEWAHAVHRACEAVGIPVDVRVTAEPGRSIAAGAAVTCYTVGTIKRIPGIRTFVSIDGGMSDNLRPALYGSRYEAFLPREALAERRSAVTIAGKHCESGDVVVRGGFLPRDLVVGDVVGTPVTGAYGYAMASNYNKVPRPPVVFVKDGDSRVVVRRETLDDMLRLDL